MSKRFWLLGFVGLIFAGLLVACGSSYNSSSNGLVLVGSQGSSVIQTFSLNLNSGHVSSLANSTNDTSNQTCILNGSPASMVANPAGTYAYVIFNASSVCQNASQPGIAVFQIKSDGSTAQIGNLTPDPNPISLAMDPTGKFLFVAEGTNSWGQSPAPTACPQTSAQYGVCVYSIGSDGTLTGVQGTFNFVNGQGFRTPNIVAVAPTPTVFPGTGINGVQNAVCTVGNTPPTSEFLYAVDADNYVVWEFSVDTSTGALGNPNPTGVPWFSTDAVPAGVAVDPCARFAYVSGNLHNKINAYTICTVVTQSPPCPNANGSLVPVAESPIAVTGSANGLGPIVVDPYGNNVYVVGTLSNTVSGFKISPVSGNLTALTPATVATGTQPKSIAIRRDDNWMFVTNYGSASVSQYQVTPATGALTTATPITTDNYPFGVAVK
ncbi:MAG TPA: beta-propeller fold lactonase family protein [Candidatus Binatia bacterium]|nr:beta-propeller fold lactonase family protein [Candidatus Binatia bacterium]